jgi:hypothetical protein
MVILRIKDQIGSHAHSLQESLLIACWGGNSTLEIGTYFTCEFDISPTLFTAAC